MLSLGQNKKKLTQEQYKNDSIIMLRFRQKKIVRQQFYGAKKTLKLWDVNINNISKLIKTNNNSKNLTQYLDKAIRLLVLILSKLSDYIKTFKDKEKNKNGMLTSFGIDDYKLFEKYKTIWARIEDFKNIKLNALPVYHDR